MEDTLRPHPQHLDISPGQDPKRSRFLAFLATLTLVLLWFKLKLFKKQSILGTNLGFLETLSNWQKMFFLFVCLVLLPQQIEAQRDKDTTKVEEREFLNLLRDAEGLNEEQKERSKRTINPRILKQACRG